MTAREKITYSVSKDEMQYLRDNERMTNREIAARLEISEPTVKKYIGPTPREITNEAILRGKRRAAEAGVKAERKQSQKPQKYSPPYAAKDWKETTTLHRLSGLYANYEVNSTIGEVEITFIDGYALGKMNKADLMKLIDEFSRIANILEK